MFLHFKVFALIICNTHYQPYFEMYSSASVLLNLLPNRIFSNNWWKEYYPPVSDNYYEVRLRTLCFLKVEKKILFALLSKKYLF